jgi:hypothetical protein
MTALGVLRRRQYDDGMTKRRVTVTLDADVLDAGANAVESGQASSLSAWINAALVRESDRFERLQALREVVAEYEAEHGAFSDDELAEQARLDEEEKARSRERIRRLRLER